MTRLSNLKSDLIPLLMALTVFFLPFERVGALESGGISLRISHILYLILFFLFLIHILKKPNTWKLNFYLIPLFLFWAVLILSLINTPNLNRGFLILLFILFTSSASFVLPYFLSSKYFKPLTHILLWSTILVCLFGLFQFAGDMLGLPESKTLLRSHYTKKILGFTRVQSTALEPLYFANFLLFPLSLSLSLFLEKRTKQDIPFSNLFLLSVMGLAILNLILTSSRGGCIAFLFTGLFIILIYFKKLLTFKNLIGLPVLLGMATVILFFSLNLYTQNPLRPTISKFQYHATDLLSGAAFDERAETIQTAYQLFLEKPLLGWGIGSYGPLISKDPNQAPSSGWPIVNNILIEVLAETGIIGTALLLLFCYYIFLRSLQAWILSKKQKDPLPKSLLIGSTACFLGICVQYQTFSTLYIFPIWFVVGFGISIQNFYFQKL